MTNDPYAQKNGTLKNKLNITDYETLNNAEKDITFSKFLNVEDTFRTKFDVEYIKSIHRHIFEDVFDWAGEFRTVPIYKEEVVIPGLSLDYTDPKNIEKELSECLDEMNSCDWNHLSLDNKTKQFTKYLARFWKIHPFRDGNTRSTLTFANQFAKEYGFPLDLGSLISQLPRTYDENGRTIQFSLRDKFVLACIPEEFDPEPQHLEKVISEAIQSRQYRNSIELQEELNKAKELNNKVEKEKEK